MSKEMLNNDSNRFSGTKSKYPNTKTIWKLVTENQEAKVTVR